MGAQSLIFQGFREKMCESVPATGVAAERGCGRGRVAGEALCQYSCRTLWRWCQEENILKSTPYSDSM
jgi:hypothetical protein